MNLKELISYDYKKNSTNIKFYFNISANKKRLTLFYACSSLFFWVLIKAIKFFNGVLIVDDFATSNIEVAFFNNRS